jgi:rhodanese-related sulfurtransferase
MAGKGPHTRRTMSFVAVAFLLLVVLLVIQFRRAPPALSAVEAYTLLARDTVIVVLDVRSYQEFNGPSGHLPRARVIPFPLLNDHLDEFETAGGRPILVYCEHGQQSLNAASLLRRRGFRAYLLEGGLLAWKARGYPVMGEE